VFAGSAQLAAIPLMAVGAPVWVIWATALCINLRFVIFSAQWRPFFMRYPLRQRLLMGYFSADLTYVLFMKRFKEPRDDEGQIEYFLGGTSANWLAWQLPRCSASCSPTWCPRIGASASPASSRCWA
jgi:predicted branched-subunit amino acid permease